MTHSDSIKQISNRFVPKPCAASPGRDSMSSSWHGWSGWQWQDDGQAAPHWWRDPDDWQAAPHWWRDPDDWGAWDWDTPRFPGAWQGQREGWWQSNLPRPGQLPGGSGAPHEEQVAGLVYRLNIPISLKECGGWWQDAKKLAEDVGLKISYRAMRLAKPGPGWYTLTAMGGGGADLLEEILKSLLAWVPDLDVNLIRVPTLSTLYPMECVADVLGNVREWKLSPPPGLTLIDARSMNIVVAGRSPQVQVWQLRNWRRRRRTRHVPGGVTPDPGVTLTSEQPRRSPSPQQSPAPPYRAPPPTPPAAQPPAPEPAAAQPPKPAAAQPPARPERSRSPPPQPPAERPPPQRPASASPASASSAIAAASAAGVTAVSLSSTPQKKMKDLKQVDVPSAAGAVDIPPFIQASSHYSRAVAEAQNISVVLGVERTRVEGRISLPNEDIKIAFCSTALRRPTVGPALIINLALTWMYRRNITWFLCDFNEDNSLLDILTENVPQAIAAGHLRVYKSYELPYWDASRAKNTAHMLPDDSYPVLVNVDGDNLLTWEFVQSALVMAHRVCQGELNLVQFATTQDGGTYGRIMIGRALFRQLGGYDESFLPSGCQDTDLILRACMCSGESVMISKPQQVGSSIANKPGATWKECVQEKVVNCDPKFAKMKWGHMDAQNRTRMHELLQKGQVQRNLYHEIGVKCTYLQPQEQIAGVTAEPDDDLESVDWGGPPAEPDDSEQLGFFVSTFGLEKLRDASGSHSSAANMLHDMWEPTRNRKPELIPEWIVRNAFLEMDIPPPQIIVDARCFIDPERSYDTRHHIGHSHVIMQKLVQHRDFPGVWADLQEQILAQKTLTHGGVTPTPLHVSFFCRAGEKRSVALAALVQAALERKGWKETRAALHLCRRFWNRRTCAGVHCPECDLTSDKHAEIADAVTGRWLRL